MNILTSDQFINILDEGIQEDSNSSIDFSDEIVSIESVGARKTYDINVTGEDHFFYANDILTHNSAVNNVDASNDSVSDSIGTIMTADFILFLLQNEKMKEEKLITAKCTKNRFTGRTDTWNMNVDYEHMRFSDAIVQGIGLTEKEADTMIIEQQFEDFKKVDEFNKKQDTPLNEEIDISAILGL